MSLKDISRNIIESGEDRIFMILWMFCFSLGVIIFMLESDYMRWLPSLNLYIVFFAVGFVFALPFMLSIE